MKEQILSFIEKRLYELQDSGELGSKKFDIQCNGRWQELNLLRD